MLIKEVFRDQILLKIIEHRLWNELMNLYLSEKKGLESTHEMGLISLFILGLLCSP